MKNWENWKYRKIGHLHRASTQKPETVEAYFFHHSIDEGSAYNRNESEFWNFKIFIMKIPKLRKNRSILGHFFTNFAIILKKNFFFKIWLINYLGGIHIQYIPLFWWPLDFHLLSWKPIYEILRFALKIVTSLYEFQNYQKIIFWSFVDLYLKYENDWIITNRCKCGFKNSISAIFLPW